MSLGDAPQRLGERDHRIWVQLREECPWLSKGDRLLAEDYCVSHRQMECADEKLMQLFKDDADPQEVAPVQRMMDNARETCLRICVNSARTARRRWRRTRRIFWD